MREAVVVASARTGLAKSYRGSFNMTRPEDLAAHCIGHVLQRTPLVEAREVEEVILGCARPWGEQGDNIARRSAVLAGLPAQIAGATVSCFGASGLRAVAMAAHAIVYEGVDAVVAGGVESFSLTKELEDDPHPDLKREMPAIYESHGLRAEQMARQYRISRSAQDEYALISQQRTARAQKAGLFDDEIAPMYVTMALIDRQTGERIGTAETCCDHDECNRPETNLETLMSLPPAFDSAEGATVTAGNSSQIADGASATLLVSRDLADELGIDYKLVYRAFAAAGCEPGEVGLGPLYAVAKILKRHGLSVDDIDLWEINEAFAVEVVHCRDQLGISMDRLNVNGGAISIGHPMGMTGSRLTGALANEMRRRPGSRYGIVTTSVAGGQGAAGLFEAVHPAVGAGIKIP